MASLLVKFQPLEAFKSRVLDAVSNAVVAGKETRQATDTIYFSSLKDFQALMTEQKYLILAAIYHAKPQSVYQLAKIVERDFPAVKHDCNMLEQLGFIVQEHTHDQRNTKIPRLKFEYDCIIVQTPSFEYSHCLGVA